MVTAGDLRPHVRQLAARHALEAVDEFREDDGRRIGDEQVNVIVLTRARHQLGPEITADLGEDRREVADCESREHVASGLCDEDQVGVEGLDDVSAPTDLHVAAPETNL